MSIYRSILFILGLLLCLGAPSACSSDPRAGAESAGAMSMPLQTTAPSGNVYQLRSATFSVFQAGATTPTTTLTTTSFNDPATTLTAPLAVGSYTIQLQTGWQVVRVDPATGGGTAITATIASPNPTSFSIASNQTTNVGFAFNVGGDGTIGFGGNLGVSISVNEVDGGTPPDGGSGSSFVLTTGVSGPGTTLPGNVQGPGIACNGSATADCSETFPAGTSVTLTAAASSASGLVFSNWTGAGCGDGTGLPLTTPTITIAMTQNVTCIASFALPQQFSLTVTLANPVGSGAGSVSGPGITCNGSATADCSESFASGASVQLTATGNAATGIAFTNWTGAGCADPTGLPLTTPTITVSMTQNVTCTANFAPATATFPPTGMNIQAWYSAEAQFITQSATGQISQWADRSGLGRHLTQTATAAQPVFNAAGWAASGQGAVVFSGAQHLASGTALGSRFNGTGVPFSLLAVIRMGSDSDGAIGTFEQTGTAVANMRLRVSDGGPFLRFQATNNAGTVFTNDDNALLSLTTGNVVAWSYTGTSSLLNTDGNPQDSSALSLGAVSTDVFRVGAAITGPSFFLNGRIAELIVLGNAVTPTEYTSFRNYARAKWAGLP